MDTSSCANPGQGSRTYTFAEKARRKPVPKYGSLAPSRRVRTSGCDERARWRNGVPSTVVVA